jgi:hypothetical protein
MMAVASIVSPTIPLIERLDRCCAELADGQSVARTIQRLLDGLDVERARLGSAWVGMIETVCRRHPLYALLAQDPVTDRARRKPRGYAGDAVLLDYIYDGLPASEHATDLGRAIMQGTTSSASARSVRDRRALLATKIDTCAVRKKGPTVFAVACGHLRELSRCRALESRALGAVYGLDQDRESLDEVTRTFREFPEVIPVAASVRDLLRDTVQVPACDLVYAAGLYDYLQDGVARLLTRRLFDMVKPGGELLIGNFVSDFPTLAYTQAFMEWPLLVRSETELRTVCDGIAPASIAAVKTWRDEPGCVVYLSLIRA